MKYEMIIFDADDTLYDFSKAELYAFKKTMEDQGLVYNSAYMSIYKDININIWKEFEEGLITQETLKTERFRRFFNKINYQANIEETADSFLKYLSQAGFLFEGVEALLQTLIKTYRLVIITNGLTRVQTHRIKNHPIAKHFEKVIISDEIGYKKPDPMIFVEGLKGLDPIDKEKTIIIGDSLTSDIQGGINFGIDTCWCNFSKKQNTSHIHPTYTIESLNEIHNILQ